MIFEWAAQTLTSFAGTISGIYHVMHSVCVYFYMYPGSINAEQTLK